jgi:hypothetical protein
MLHVVNTHYDDMGLKARAESSLIIREYARQWVGDKGLQGESDAPFILVGDFSGFSLQSRQIVVLTYRVDSPPNEDGYRFITSPHALPSGAASLTFIDAFTSLSLRNNHSSSIAPRQSAPYGPLHTYTGFAAPGKERETKRIDFIMLASETNLDNVRGEEERDRSRGRGGWRAVKYACIDNWIEEGDVDGWVGRWSDHRAVRVVLARD